MTQLVMIPRDRNLWLRPQDVIDRGLAVPGTVSEELYSYSDPWRGDMTTPCLKFELTDGYTHIPGLQDVSFYDKVGQWDVGWLEKATGRILDEQRNEIVTYVLHEHSGAFILRFFELPLQPTSLTEDLLS
jgi:hypothetical protein